MTPNMRLARNVGIPVAVLAVIGAVAFWQWRGADKEPRVATPVVAPPAAPAAPPAAPLQLQPLRPMSVTLTPVPPGAEVRPPHSDPQHPPTQPAYPAIAKQLNEEGAVVMLLTVTETGSVAGADIETSSGFATLDEAALQEAKRWTLQPGTINGTPAIMQYKFKIAFRMADAN